MGFSTSGAAAIVFVGLLVSTTIAFPALESAYDARASAMDQRDQRALDIKNTAIDVSVEADASDELAVLVENTGSTTLSVDGTDLLVDGEYRYVDADGDGTAADGGAVDGTWVDGTANRSTVQPGETLRIETADQIADVDRVKVVGENGVAGTVTGV